MHKKVQVIINPAAGQDRPILGILNKVFREAGIDWDVSITKEAGDAARLAKQAVSDGADVVAVHGGDGTVMECASGLIGTRVPLAIIPGGTANVMSIELGISNDVAEASSLITHPDLTQIKRVDMGQVGDRYFMLRVGMGFEAALVEGADRSMKERMGNLAYILSGLQALANPAMAQYHLTLDGETFDVEGITCMVANSGSVGTPGLNLAQGIDVCDGMLDVVVVRKGDIGTLVSVAASVLIGTASPEPLQHWQARNIRIESTPEQTVQVDGEIIGNTPVEIKVIPQALMVLAPKPKEAVEPAPASTTDQAGFAGALPAAAV
jgi:diacylglycerol kinase (ATP)